MTTSPSVRWATTPRPTRAKTLPIIPITDGVLADSNHLAYNDITDIMYTQGGCTPTGLFDQYRAALYDNVEDYAAKIAECWDFAAGRGQMTVLDMRPGFLQSAGFLYPSTVHDGDGSAFFYPDEDAAFTALSRRGRFDTTEDDAQLAELAAGLGGRKASLVRIPLEALGPRIMPPGSLAAGNEMNYSLVYRLLNDAHFRTRLPEEVTDNVPSGDWLEAHPYESMGSLDQPTWDAMQRAWRETIWRMAFLSFKESLLAAGLITSQSVIIIDLVVGGANIPEDHKEDATWLAPRVNLPATCGSNTEAYYTTADSEALDGLRTSRAYFKRWWPYLTSLANASAWELFLREIPNGVFAFSDNGSNRAFDAHLDVFAAWTSSGTGSGKRYA